MSSRFVGVELNDPFPHYSAEETRDEIAWALPCLSGNVFIMVQPIHCECCKESYSLLTCFHELSVIPQFEANHV